MTFRYPDYSRDIEGRSSLEEQIVLQNFNNQQTGEKHLLYLDKVISIKGTTLTYVLQACKFYKFSKVKIK
jgi:hypothetical protein